jgi:dihydroorotate dehydrogenase
MYPLIRPLLFKLEPEQAHNLTVELLRLAGRAAPFRAFLRALFSGPPCPVRAFGLDFSNPIGLAAGYDKDGLGWRGLSALGFGHIEVGTVTPQPQAGNPRPRLFRLVEDQAVINRMGFPGRGAEFVKRQISGARGSGAVLGVNLGKNKDTPLEEAAGDYLNLLKSFAPFADYLAINVSSPNTVGLRRLQSRDALEGLLGELDKARREESNRLGRRLPLLVKLAPDLSMEELDDALETIIGENMDGVIATNTTLDRPPLRSGKAGEAGGLSGAPLRAKSSEIIRYINRQTRGRLPVVGVGGVMQARDAQEKLDAGAVLVQVYTGLIYAGPGLVKTILKGLHAPGYLKGY